jgi:DMSO/TMAO reductase YedYZ molybdopterin-dependent catalytic subunit
MKRRQFLQTAAAIPFAGVAVHADMPEVPALIERTHAPQNLEMNFASMSDVITPTPSFYVRNHFAQPKIDLKTWRLKIEGAVEKPIELSLDELQKLGSKTTPLTFECAGNNRAVLKPAAKGVGWQSGAVGNAEWTGIPLKDLLGRAGVKKTAVEVILEGADTGTVADLPAPIPFARSLSLEKANKPETILAWSMNGKDLPASHGFPLRAVVGGWYGVASVKWLSRIIVTDCPFHGFFQSLDYTYFERTHGLATLLPITAMQVKSLIARPTAGDSVTAGNPAKISGAAWAGEADVAKIEVSTDGGKTWNTATLSGKSVPFCWRLWEYEWKSPTAGKAVLMSRATDNRGQTQSMERNTDLRNYMITHVIPVEIEVR